VDAEELIRQAADSVHSALDEARRRAKEIVDEAHAEAKRIRAEAEQAASRIRGEAEGQAQRRLEDVRNALDQLEGSLGSSRDGDGGRDGTSVATDAEVQPGPVTVPEPAPPATPEPVPEPGPEPVPEPVPEPSPPPDETDPPSPTPSNDAAARLVAMKLALDGTSREDARKELAADYDVADLDVLLDEVYARAGH
jgi:outer membrane biosynthesis protein TonB